MPTRTPTLTDLSPSLAPLVLAFAAATATAAPSPDALTLRSQHEVLRDAFASSPFRRPLVVQSSEADSGLKGEIYAIVDHPFKTAAPVLEDRARWCELLMLHQNVKRCRAGGDAPADTVALVVGRKAEHTAEQGFRMDFKFRVAERAPDFLSVQLASASGPLGTRDHRVTLQAAPLDARRSIIHLSYGYASSGVARLATQAYMATAGRHKVGFTVTGKTDDGKPVYISGMRGLVERNAMRYFLAIEAYFGALATPPAQQWEKRLHDWFALIEQHPRQLHDMGRDEYLAIKRRDLAAL
jgi:hypothetical protein